MIPTHELNHIPGELQDLRDQIINGGGIKAPIAYVEYNGGKYIVDGHHRRWIAILEGFGAVPVAKVNLPYKDINDLFY